MEDTMTINEAFQELLDSPTEYLWCRPVAWNGSRQGLVIRDGRVQVVPTARGGSPWHPNLQDLLDVEWEVIDSSDVLAEEEI